jgi:hypothetical protein
MLTAAKLPDGLQRPSLIQSVTQRAAASLATDGGHPCVSEFGSDGSGWRCGRQTASVETEIPVGGVYRRVIWQLISVAREDVVDDVHWRIEQVIVQ